MEIDESLFRFAMKNDILVWILNDWLNWKNDWLCNLHRFCKLVIFALSTALVCPSVPQSIHLLIFSHFHLLFRNHLANSTKLSTKHFWWRSISDFFFSRTTGPISTKEDGWIWWIKCPFNTKYRLLESAFTLSVFTIECSVLHVDTCSTTPSPTQPVLQTTTFFFAILSKVNFMNNSSQNN